MLLQWRRDVIRHLSAKGCGDVGYEFKNCGCSCFIDLCPNDVTHAPKAVPLHCGLRICPECARRESYRLLLAYLPKLTELLGENPDFPDYKLRKLVLTTPYELTKLTAESFKEKQKLVKDFLDQYFFEYFAARKRLSKAEIRSGRCNLKQHNIGGIQAAEFGERGKKLHWHILIYAPYMVKNDIWRVWETVTRGQCTNVNISELKPSSDELQYAGADLLEALQEIVKYSTKFTAIKAKDVPHLHKVLRGNRRFRAFGILYNSQIKHDKPSHVCETCSAEREHTTVSEWLHRCQIQSIPPDDEIVIAVESGIALYLSRDTEISSGERVKTTHKARDSLESDHHAIEFVS